MITEGACGTNHGIVEVRLAPGRGVPLPPSAGGAAGARSDIVALVLEEDGSWSARRDRLEVGVPQAELQGIICTESGVLVLGVDPVGGHPYLHRFDAKDGWTQLDPPPDYLGLPLSAKAPGGAIVASERAGTFRYFEGDGRWVPAATDVSAVGNLTVSAEGIFVGSRLVEVGSIDGDPAPAIDSVPSAARVFG